jgi:hypothetical protein
MDFEDAAFYARARATSLRTATANALKLFAKIQGDHLRAETTPPHMLLHETCFSEAR